MSPPWSRPLEVERLAEAQADVDFAIPLAELPGLRSARAGVAGVGGVAGQVSGRVHFGRERTVPVAELTLKGSARLQCQRCLQPLEVPLEAHVRIALLGSAAESARAPADLEPMLAPGGRISVGELVSEEVGLSLPIVPLHGDGEGCEAAAGSALAAEAAAAGETHRPFARLGELLKR